MKTYVVRSGDSLSSIAKNQLGSAVKWRELLEANAAVVSDPNALTIGMTLVLPKVASPPIHDMPAGSTPWRRSE